MSKKASVNVSNFKTEAHVSTDTSKGTGLPLLFTKRNYQLLLLGLAVIFSGFLLMMGKNNNIEGAPVFPADDIYSMRRIIIAPIVVIIGFLINLYAIISVKKNS